MKKNKSLVKEEAEIQTKDPSQYVPQRDKIDFELKIRNLNWTEKQKAFIELATDKETRVVFLSGPAGTSKAQPLDAQILTPKGWELMGNIKEGDYVYSVHGTPTKVLSIHPQGVKDIYKVSFSDGTSTECTKDHLWTTKTYNQRSYLQNFTSRNNRRVKNNKAPHENKDPKFLKECERGSVKTLEEIMSTLLVGNGKKLHRNHTIPLVNKPVQFEAKPHIISPYTMGILLGDGCLRTQVMFTTADKEILEKIKGEIPSSVQIKLAQGIDYRFIGTENNKNPFLEEIRRLSLAGTYSDTKFIPNEYLFDSADNRLELLKGLMDSDGFISVRAKSEKTNMIGFSTTSKQLSEGVRFLIESLGGTTTTKKYKTSYTYKEEKKAGKEVYNLILNVPVNPFHLSRKSEMFKERVKYFPARYVTKVELVGQKPAQCILVEDSEHLYLTNNFIVTHNTVLAVKTALELMQLKKASEIIYVRSVVESASNSLGSLPGEAQDKFRPFAMPLLDKLEELLPSGDIKKLLGTERVKPIPVNYLRGASYNANVVIVDEAQNFTLNELITVITRIGKFSKFLILGDPMQTDLKHKEHSGFKPLFDIFNDEESQAKGIYCVEFGKEDIMRSELLKFIVERIHNFQASKPK